jgi:predicted SnoaL-like aldol condensation-catalyzing enzyme
MQEQEHKNIALSFFKLVEEGKFKEGLQYFSPNCITHNPYFSGTISNLVDAMVEANKQGMSEFPKAAFSVRQVLSDGDYVAVYTQLLNNIRFPLKEVCGKFTYFVLKMIKLWSTGM